MRAFLKAAQDDRLEAMWLVGLMIGLRPGKLCGLTWSDIDLDGKVIHVNGLVCIARTACGWATREDS